MIQSLQVLNIREKFWAIKLNNGRTNKRKFTVVTKTQKQRKVTLFAKIFSSTNKSQRNTMNSNKRRRISLSNSLHSLTSSYKTKNHLPMLLRVAELANHYHLVNICLLMLLQLHMLVNSSSFIRNTSPKSSILKLNLLV